MCCTQTTAPEGGNNSVSEYNIGFPAAIHALCRASECMKKAYVQRVIARRRRSQTYCRGRKSIQNLFKMKTKSSPNGAKSHKSAPPRPPRPPRRENVLVFYLNLPPHGAQMEAKRNQNRAKIESENELISVIVFSSFRGGFWKAKVVENHSKSVPEGARERKRKFSENVGFAAVKP